MDEIERLIMDRITSPGWVTTRGILKDPAGAQDSDEHRAVETAMKKLAKEGKVVLWNLILDNDGIQLLAAAKPGYELGNDLEERGAWAKAVPYVED